MAPGEWTSLRRWIAILGVVVVARVLAGIVSTYGSYLPSPDFGADFLVGREASFFRGGYRVAFLAHILAGPPALVLAIVLAAPAPRRRFPRWHRRLGWCEAALVGLILAPSGLTMATEPLPWLPPAERLVAGIGFATLALSTGAAVALGVVAARRRRFVDHARWMTRLVALLLSAPILRIMGGVAALVAPDLPWTYAASAWGSWLMPLLAVEVAAALGGTGRSVSGPCPAASRRPG